MLLHDIHIHTALSACCSDDKATSDNYIKKAKELGLKTIGFSDHMWESEKIKGASPWYLPQNFSHISKIKENISMDNEINILFGVETEFANDTIALTEETASKLDYVLCPHSHFHMSGFTIPAHLKTHKELAKHMVKTFKNVASINFITSIAHPFDACVLNKDEDLIRMFSFISDEEFIDCFSLAKENGIGIEINMASFKLNTKETYEKTYLRMLRLAKHSLCKFSFGSDTHSINNFESILNIRPILAQLDITNDDIIDLLNEGR